jgi:hypothetical protein
MKNSLKYIGFIVVVFAVVLVIRPDLFFGKKDADQQEMTDDQTTRKGNASADDSDYTDPRKPSLLVKDNNVKSEGITEYAEGYDESDFGDAFNEPENMFQISENEGRQSAGGLWEVLLELQFDIALDEALNDVVMRPMFTQEIKDLNNKVVEIEGFIVPFEIVADATGRDDGSMFMLSAFPAATCFFCKGAGPESVMEVYPAKPIPYTKNKVKIKGKLVLNDFDYLKMAYLLEDAEMVE